MYKDLHWQGIYLIKKSRSISNFLQINSLDFFPDASEVGETAFDLLGESAIATVEYSIKQSQKMS